jgi:hypothetical protein
MHHAVRVLYLVPRGSPGLLLKLRLIILHKNLCCIFSWIYFPSFSAWKRQKGDFAKNNVNSRSFYPSIRSISSKISNKVIKKVNAFVMHQRPIFGMCMWFFFWNRKRKNSYYAFPQNPLELL